MDLAGHISDLITVATEMKQQPGVNKKAINKAIARLEEAQLWAEKIYSGRINGVPSGSTAPIKGSKEQCSCPPGVVDNINCPVHKL